LQSSISAWWGVVQGNGSSDGILSVLKILVLPDPPCAVDLCMVEEEGWVAWGCENVSAWVTTNSEVAACVYTAVEERELVTVYLSKVWGLSPI
jgi:hypothetical protein